MRERTYRITLKGETSLLLHNDNIEWADFMKRWQNDPANAKKSVKGDDRSPGFTWIGNLYHEGGKLVIPADNLMSLLREGGKRCPTGKGKATFKRQTQSGIIVNESAWAILVDGAEIPWEPFENLIGEEAFELHEEAARAHGFELFVKRAKIGQNKHVRVRPRFQRWACIGTLTVFDEEITTDTLANIMTFAGAYSGLGDWRPSSPSAPGPFGKFTAAIKEI